MGAGGAGRERPEIPVGKRRAGPRPRKLCGGGDGRSRDSGGSVSEWDDIGGTRRYGGGDFGGGGGGGGGGGLFKKCPEGTRRGGGGGGLPSFGAGCGGAAVGGDPGGARASAG